ncbi:MAG: AsmA-like C-terminal region-containing protein [Salibacteraceae bacterium]
MKKFLVILGVVMLLIISVIVAIPMMFKTELQELAIDEANKTINAEVSMGDFDLSLIPNFPKLTVEISDLAILGKDDFESVTLFQASSITTTLDVMKLYNGDVEINEVGMSGVDVHVQVLKNGKANYDITFPEDTNAVSNIESDPEMEEPIEEGASDFQMKLKRYFIHDFNLIYDDQLGDMLFEIEKLNHEGKGDFTLSQFILETSTQIEAMSFKLEGDELLKRAKLNSEINMAMDMDAMRFQFDTTFVQLNALILNMDGWLAMPNDSIDMDLKMSTKNNSFKELFSLVPNAYIEGYEDVKVAGSMSLAASFKGIYYEELMPGFKIDLDVKNGQVQYPDLPATAKNIGIDLHVNSPAGDMSRMIVDLRNAHLELADNYFDMSLMVKKTITNPTITGNFKMDFDLATIPTMMPVEDGEEYKGKLKTDLNYKLDMNSLDTEQYDKVEANGLFEAWNIAYDDGSGGIPMEIEHVAMIFDMNKVNLTAFDARVGKSDIHATGGLENFIPWYMHEEKISGVLDFNSNYFDADEWMEEEEEEEGEEISEKESSTSIDSAEESVAMDSSSTETYEIPTNVYFKLNSSMKKIAYDSMDIQNLNGAIVIENGQVLFEGVGIEMFEGNATLDGVFDPTTHPKNPTFDFDMGIHDWAISPMANTYNTIDKLAPILKSATGTFSTDIEIHGVLDSALEPILEKMNFRGVTTTKDLEVKGNNLEKLNTITKTKNYNPLKAKDLKLEYKCVNGVLEVEPFDIVIGTQSAKVSGYTTLEQDINYIIDTQIKTSEMGAGGDAIIGQVNNLLKNNGVNAEVPDIIPVVISVTGKMDDPQFKPVFGKGEQSAEAKEQVKKIIKDQIEEVKKDLKKDLQAEADKIMEDARKQQVALMAEANKQAAAMKVEAEKLGAQLRAEADKQGKDLIKQATNPLAKIAATKGAEQMNKEADKKAKQLVAESEKQGKKLVDQAKTQSDKIIVDAQKRANEKIKGI